MGTLDNNLMPSSLSSILEQLLTMKMAQVFNPYLDIDQTNDHENSASIRQQNITHYLENMVSRHPTTMWIGESLGRRGGKRTGLPFTDEPSLAAFSSVYDIPAKRATIGPAVAEQTAAAIWQQLPRANFLPMLWNIFPFHPFSEKEINRSCRRDEIAKALPITLQLLELIKPMTIIAIGKMPFQTLKKRQIDITYIRHPSHGGRAKFIEQITPYLSQ